MKKLKLTAALLALMFAAAFTFGCGGGETGTEGDPDADAIAAAKTLVEAAAYGPAAQSSVTSRAQAKAYVEGVIAGLELNGVESAVINDAFTAAVAGTVTALNGTNGSYRFAVELTKGAAEPQTTKELTLVITATPSGAEQLAAPANVSKAGNEISFTEVAGASNGYGVRIFRADNGTTLVNASTDGSPYYITARNFAVGVNYKAEVYAKSVGTTHLQSETAVSEPFAGEIIYDFVNLADRNAFDNTGRYYGEPNGAMEQLANIQHDSVNKRLEVSFGSTDWWELYLGPTLAAPLQAGWKVDFVMSFSGLPTGRTGENYFIESGYISGASDWNFGQHTHIKQISELYAVTTTNPMTLTYVVHPLTAQFSVDHGRFEVAAHVGAFRSGGTIGADVRVYIHKIRIYTA